MILATLHAEKKVEKLRLSRSTALAKVLKDLTYLKFLAMATCRKASVTSRRCLPLMIR